MKVVWVGSLFLIGLLFIIKGGDLFVDGATWLAKRFGIPPLLVGATIVSLATTLPEIIVSALAASQGKIEMAVGNSVGSVSTNLGLALGISLLFLPGVVKSKGFTGQALLMLTACVTITGFSMSGQLIRSGVIILAVLFFFFLWSNIQAARQVVGQKNVARTNATKEPGKMNGNVLKLLGGATGIVVGAHLLVEQGSTIAAMLGVPESVIAVTMIAVGTSLPELVTAVTALLKGQLALSIGNVIGANIIDLTLILPLCTVISGENLTVSRQAMYLDFPFCLFFALIAVFPVLLKGRTRRLQGALLLSGYAAYIAILCNGMTG